MDFAATPRASLAYYLARPSNSGWLSGTKLNFSFGKGIKEPSIYYQSISLFDILDALPNGGELIRQYHVSPIGPETSRTYDGGVDQQLWNGRARITLTYFHNEFTNGVEFVPQSALACARSARSQRPCGSNLEQPLTPRPSAPREPRVATEYKIGSHLFARGGYTYLDALVQQSFSSESLPSYNPSFPTIAIGAFSPLSGGTAVPARSPLRLLSGLLITAPNGMARLPVPWSAGGTTATFLPIRILATPCCCPTATLMAPINALNLGAATRSHDRLTPTLDMQNLLSEHYSEAFGYPALPFSVRAGIKISSWRRILAIEIVTVATTHAPAGCSRTQKTSMLAPLVLNLRAAHRGR